MSQAAGSYRQRRCIGGEDYDAKDGRWSVSAVHCYSEVRRVVANKYSDGGRAAVACSGLPAAHEEGPKVLGRL